MANSFLNFKLELANYLVIIDIDKFDLQKEDDEMIKNSVRKLLVGILNFCPKLNIPADSRAVHKSLKKYNDIYPELFYNIVFFTEVLEKESPIL